MSNILYDTPYEKYEKFGPENMTDAELLSIILRNGSKDMDVLTLSDYILSANDSSKRIIGIQNMSFNDLLKIKGIGKIKAMCIGSLLELSKRMHFQEHESHLQLSNPQIISETYMEKLRHLKQECVFLLLVDVKCKLIKEIRLTTGTVNSSVISIRDIFAVALDNKAFGIIILHNHPSGDPTPSDEDMKITAKLNKASEIMDIPLIDHIIIGDIRFFSFKSMGYI